MSLRTSHILALTTCLLVLACRETTEPGATPDNSHPLQLRSGPAASPSAPLRVGRRPHSGGLRLADVRRLAPGFEALAPRFSPRDHRLLFTGPSYRGLFVADLDDDRVLTLSKDESLGYWAAWQAEAAVSAAGEGLPLWRFDRAGNRTLAAQTSRLRISAPGSNGRRYFIRDDAVWVEQGASPALPLAAAPEGRAYALALSPDGGKLAIQVLGRGLFVRLLDSQVLLGAGRGSNPAWFPDSQRLVFNVSEDDGARLTGSELVLLDCRTGNQGKLTDTPDFKEMHPTVSYDGKHLAFVSDLDLYVAKIVE